MPDMPDLEICGRSPFLLCFGLSCFPHDARKEVLDFTPFCVHQDVVGAVPGIDWDLVQSVEKYKASLEVPSNVLATKFLTLHLFYPMNWVLSIAR